MHYIPNGTKIRARYPILIRGHKPIPTGSTGEVESSTPVFGKRCLYSVQWDHMPGAAWLCYYHDELVDHIETPLEQLARAADG